ncbi:UDP-N-acetylmuramoyl-L-alanyl-D-glutamate--2,6-diaminopimelate ligase [Xylella fastidiosa]|uniref:UDP-N-acetylmuramoyl-L-alanyl-D-glutamate--2,6-diaminopimelate ligase n=1 Tax=Xylella fastidiosa (strain 9a5c) TaxID=160492 RepID=MURE_XYLFA|nr:UDP-N-acetylmuramoyl-L-alanyl-D-glutamate--2,6-diaminopimelate ligase [Xylella fastidiosa]Q9PF85.1 RecName: Full=UDP-N-acetylmuramoyl-L-alanyl-D-glutamate--2,6-diaminopimelate ligase; AltName: Full=Meso-A2pm-adding enzyme; AltName: Full=Meso-diaminopimelate-adding enzyme; AltName: Full=UDP-MurNAc-L-Ala-D-Glu:meso-diaminopimelate ligase; AltName: Full=UDP-MurNAc-tripeptide synthetase; AltName: Full=UDP-N-acetylmuramyl-tripeptide synthetase [Xylella fastidiosa 9a5c]AAF83603.1 UDP-N-acetylmuramoy
MRRSMPLAQLLPDIPQARDVVISGLVMDSREVQPGDAFVAVAGFGAHGLCFIEDACARGAVAILFEPPAPQGVSVPDGAIAVHGLRARLGAMADRFHGHPSQAMTMVGVTGTNGKTSTVQLLAQAWHCLGVRSATCGTLGVGLYDQVVPTGFTTPLVLQLHQCLAQLRDEGAQAVAMEVSSHALDQGRVDGVHYDVVVFTNLTRDHLDYHGDMEHYGAAKARLFAHQDVQAAVINVDDPFGLRLLHGLAKGMRRVGVSVCGHTDADVMAQHLSLNLQGIGFDLVIGADHASVRSPLMGRFNVDNLLAVAGVLYALNYALSEIAAVLSTLRPIHGRMNRLGGQDGQPVVVVDYAHTPDALGQVLSSLSSHVCGRLICVFGCGGERDRGKRSQMAVIAESNADVVFVTDDNPRGEDGDGIVADILAGFARPNVVKVQRDRSAAIAAAIGIASAEDVVLIAGKGHERYQEVAGVRHPFDDTEVARRVLAAMSAQETVR